MKVCISGYYGSQNTGDELLLQVMREGITRALGEVEFNVLAAAPHIVRDLHPELGRIGPNTGWQGPKKIKAPPSANKDAREILRESDLLVLGGGGLMGHDCVYNYNEVQFCHKHGIPVVALGVGCDPFTTGSRDKYQKYFEMFSAVTTRDFWSYSNLKNVSGTTKVVECADPVFSLYPARQPESVKNKVILIMTTILRWGPKGSSEQDTRIRRWANVLSQVAEELEVELELYPFSPHCKWHDDRVRAKEFQDRFPGQINIMSSETSGYADVVDDLNNCRAVISDRYHGLILSALNGIPFLGVAQDTKQRNVSLQLNQPWLYPENREGRHNIEASFRDLLMRETHWRKELLDHRGRIIEMAEQNFDVLKQL